MRFPDRKKLASLSRDRSAIIKGASFIGGASFVIALIVSLITAGGLGNLGSMPLVSDEKKWDDFLERLGEELEDEYDFKVDTAERFATQIRYVEPDPDSANDLRDLLAGKTTISDDEKKRLQLFIDALHGTETEKIKAESELTTLSTTSKAPRFANEFLGDIFSRKEQFEEAVSKFQSEVERFPDDALYAKSRVLDLMLHEGKYQTLKSIYKKAPYNVPELLDHRIRVATEIRDIPFLFRAALYAGLARSSHEWWNLFLTFFSASIWFIIIGQFRGFKKSHLLSYFVAILLGIFSIVLTLFLIFVQEDIYGFQLERASSYFDQAFYWIAGVGLREEFCKLLCFVPLAFFLRKKRDYALAFVCASMVGLGFALWENLNYFLETGAFTSWSRFMTANFFHISLTGIVGVSLYNTICRKGRGWENFLIDFLLVVCVHGVYNALISFPELDEVGGLLNIIVFALFTYRYLDTAEHHMEINRSQAISPLGIFCIGAALLIGVVFVFAAYGSTFTDALSNYLFSLSGMAVIAFIFINRFKNA